MPSTGWLAKKYPALIRFSLGERVPVVLAESSRHRGIEKVRPVLVEQIVYYFAKDMCCSRTWQPVFCFPRHCSGSQRYLLERALKVYQHQGNSYLCAIFPLHVPWPPFDVPLPSTQACEGEDLSVLLRMERFLLVLPFSLMSTKNLKSSVDDATVDDDTLAVVGHAHCSCARDELLLSPCRKNY